MKIGNEDVKLYLGSAEISNIYLGTEQVYSGGSEPTPPAPSYDTQYLTIESTSDNNTIIWKTSYTGLVKTISASTDNGSTWTEYTSTNEGTTIATLNTGDKVLVKGTNETYANSTSNYNRFLSNNSFIAYGNIMSLISGDSFENADTLTGTYTFIGLFKEATGLTSAENLILPATTLATYCYYDMFRGCTSLTTAPELPATTLVNNCYRQMFQGCTSLNYIKCLAIDISANRCTFNWVTGVAETGTFVKAASMSNWTFATSGIPPYDWTVQNDDGTPIGSGEVDGGFDDPS